MVKPIIETITTTQHPGFNYMIPQISQAPGLSPQVLSYIETLTKQGFTGDIATDYGARLSMSVDNSIYQCLPDAIVFPRSVADVTLVSRIAGQTEFAGLTFTARGGGTGTNGQSLNQGVIVDLSRHMNHILEINTEEGWVKVEAGVVKDQLNQWLKPYGFFFSPELSTSNRATLGGMINTDASGQGSLVYGKTSDHVLGLRAVLDGGELIDTRAMPVSLAENIAAEQTREGHIYHEVLSACRENRQLIIDKFPKLNRFLTGYDLRHVLSDDLQTFDLTRILCGSEGTLAFITEARLDITRIPKIRQLVNIKYDSFDSALRNAPFLVQANALSVETVDSKVLNLAREDIVWHSVSELITDVPGEEMLGLNLVEFAGDDVELAGRQVSDLCERLDKLMAEKQAGIIGYQLCTRLDEVERIYAMRKKAVGLLGNAKGHAKPIPFVEDTAVPPEHLADYITDFRALLDGHGLSYGMFGHVDAGVLHVRPALDMCDPQQEVLMKRISDEVVALTASYGGLLWGEHGKGYRGAYTADFFGPELFYQVRRIKRAFDPQNRLNPGKICTPLGSHEQLKPIESPTRGSFDRQIPVTVRDEWRGAMECNGNGLCFNFDVNSPMCPSMKITRNRLHSPKGRATLTREWLRLLADQGINPQQLEQTLPQNVLSLRGFISKLKNTRQAAKGRYDFSHEVKEAMSGCLGCKACSTQCPIKIDVPSFRSRFLQLYHSRYLRPVSDHLVASVESYTPLMAKAPRLFNFFLTNPQMQALSKKYIGMVDLPALSSPTLKHQLAGHQALQTTPEDLRHIPAAQRQEYVLVVQDPFTSYYEASLVSDFIRLISRLGFKPVLLPFTPNGKAQHVKGFLQRFAKTAQKSADFLNEIAALGIPMVGTDPALVLCYRDEYQQVLGEKRGNFNVLLAHEWLDQVTADRTEQQPDGDAWYLFPHCTENTALPMAAPRWKTIFSRFGAALETVNAGCCGMAGTYGHETKNLENSLGIYQLSWQPHMEKRARHRCLATGYSCRSQVKRIEGEAVRHPLQALLEIVR